MEGSERKCSIIDRYGCSHGVRYTKEDFSAEDWISLKARTGVKLRRICENHVKNYLKLYHLKQNACCDPFKRHTQRQVKSLLKPITVSMFLKSRGALEFSGPLIPGKCLCRPCYTDATKMLKLVEGFDDPPSSAASTAPNSASASQDLFAEEENQERQRERAKPKEATLNVDQILDKILAEDEDEQEDVMISSGSSYHPSPRAMRDAQKAEGVEFESSPRQKAIDKANESLQVLGVSPILKRKLSAPTYLPSKLQKIEEEIETLCGVSPAADGGSAPGFEETIIGALQEKFQKSTNTADKIHSLSVALTAYSQKKVLELFKPVGASDYIVRKTHYLMQQQDGLFPSAAPKRGHRTSDETATLVRSFYETDENSRQLPGKRDFISLRVDGKKVHVQKRLVLCNIRELFALFKSKYPEVDIGFSKFASLRPKNCVLAGASGTHTVCVCKYHQNIKLMMDGVNFKELDINILTYQDLISAVICENPTAECFLNSCCPNCPGLDSLLEKLLDLLSERFVEEITFKQWTSTDRSSLEIRVMKMDEFVAMLIAQLKNLLPHHYVAKAQSKQLSESKENLQDGEVIVVSDFSENYSFVVQDSVQGYYWTNDQATVHPFVCYHKVNEKLESLSFIVVSDYMKHNISAVYAFQVKLVKFLKEKITNLVKLIFFSDGAAQQYKNCFNMINLTYHAEDFQIDAEWHFFATSHGKGPSDGLGGQFKRNATRESLQGTLIRSPLELYQWAAAKEGSTVTVAYVTASEVNELKAFLKPRFYSVINVQGMRDMHFALPLSIGELSCKRTSSSLKSTYSPVSIIRKKPSWQEINEGDYIAIQIQKSWKIAQVILKNSPDDGPPEEEGGDLEVVFYNKEGVSSQELGVATWDTVICKVNPSISHDEKVQLTDYDIMKISWQSKIIQGKKFSQPDQIRNGTWE